MKVLVLGSNGMLGHIVHEYLSLKGYDVMGIARTPVDGLNIRVLDILKEWDKFVRFVRKDKPDVIINCIGILVRESEVDLFTAIGINAMLPHSLSMLCNIIGTKLIHISTDCVFDGNHGPYTEGSVKTEVNNYGRTKSLGELVNDKDLTIRTSIIGPELKHGTGLFVWYRSQKGTINGYAEVMWNGVTTLECAKQIVKILEQVPNMNGIYHLTTTEPISKANLLRTIGEVFGGAEVKDVSEPSQNKCLTNTRIEEYNPLIPSYRDQLTELKRFMVEIDAL